MALLITCLIVSVAGNNSHQHQDETALGEGSNKSPPTHNPPRFLRTIGLVPQMLSMILGVRAFAPSMRIRMER